MKFVAIGIFTVVTLLSYSCQQTNNQTTNQQEIAAKEPVPAAQQIDTLGPIILTIDFKQKATGEDLKIFDNGYIPWISIDNPAADLSKLVDADKIILAYPNAKIIIDYPLANPATFEITTTAQGFSRKDLILKISEGYHEIYDLEESTAKTKTIPADKREGLINRNQTDGKFGVWGHDISDLDLSQIEVHKNTNGKITLTLGVES